MNRNLVRTLLGGLAGAATVIIVTLVTLTPPETAKNPPAFAGLMGDFTFFDPPPPVPGIGFTDADDRPVRLADFAGQVVLLNFWATWCGPCVREMPALDRLEATLGGDGFRVVTLSVDRRGLELVRPFYKRYDLASLGVYLDPKNKVMRAFGVGRLPTSFLIGADGKVLARLEGAAEWDGAEAVAFMRYYIRGAR